MEVEDRTSDSNIARRLKEIENDKLFRKRKTIESAQGRQVQIGNRKFLNFCSNNYLGLANHPSLIKAFQQAVNKFGVGSGASSLVSGRNSAHVELEEEVVRFTGRDKALLFSSGYLANLSIISTLVEDRNDHIFQDKLNHASMIDAALLSRGKLIRYPHADVEALEVALHRHPFSCRLVLTESVFSMGGDIAPLKAIAKLCSKQNASFVVDDAHGFGVFGNQGKGTLDLLQLKQSDVPVMMATFGKALGCSGAFIAGSDSLIELFVQKARPYIFTTAMAPALAVAAREALGLLQSETWRQDALFTLIERFRKGAQQLSLQVQDSSSPIQPLLTGSAERALQMSEFLYDNGFLVTPIRPPTVPVNTSRLRITISAEHIEEDIDMLLEALSLAEAKLRDTN
jgi:8-amino-7-oxononanoate synthase